jgi:hypothetical protein
MLQFKKTILPILLTGIWINISETLRWEFIVKNYWIEHYQNLNLVFPVELSNNLTWMTWGFLFAAIIFILSKKFNTIQTTFLSWFLVFVMLWIVLWNVEILPKSMLWIVAPLSLLEAYVGALICRKFLNKREV